jgi:cytochrome P450
MDEEQVVANAILLLLAGHETTINLICNGTRAFMTHPDQWEPHAGDAAGQPVVSRVHTRASVLGAGIWPAPDLMRCKLQRYLAFIWDCTTGIALVIIM